MWQTIGSTLLITLSIGMAIVLICIIKAGKTAGKKKTQKSVINM